MPQAIELSSPEKPRTKDHIDPTHPLLEAKRATIESIRRATFVYGETDVHKLDVYYPGTITNDIKDECSTAKCTPILVFFYGGGLVQGSRSSPPSHLVHNNLGAFFAAKGILAIIPDYRLVPSITFPQGSEDVRDALRWVIQSAQDLKGDPSRLYVLAHSAGGVHVSGCLLTPTLFEPVARSLQGVALLGVPFTGSRQRQDAYATALRYYGNSQSVLANEPLALLQAASEECTARLPPILNLRAASEPGTIRESIRLFTQTLASKGVQVEELVLAGHDHMSPIMALSSGHGEEWGNKVAEWILGVVNPS